MKFIEFTNGTYWVNNPVDFATKTSSSISGIYRWNYPVYPNYDLDIHTERISGVKYSFRFETVIRKNNTFISFIDKYEHNSLINDEIVNKYMNLFKHNCENFIKNVNVRKFEKNFVRQSK